MEKRTPSDALREGRALIRSLAEKHRTRNPRVFGSTARGEDTADSDLDILVDTIPGTSLFNLGGLQVELEDALRVRVDVRTPLDLPARFRQRVLDEARPI